MDDRAAALLRIVTAQVARLAADLTPQQLEDLIEGRASLTLVDVEPANPRPPHCVCPCDHVGGCALCECRCDPVNPGVCPCCGASAGELLSGG